MLDRIVDFSNRLALVTCNALKSLGDSIETQQAQQALYGVDPTDGRSEELLVARANRIEKARRATTKPATDALRDRVQRDTRRLKRDFPLLFGN